MVALQGGAAPCLDNAQQRVRRSVVGTGARLQ